MKTKDLTQRGIDRNFIRKCIDKGIITPSQTSSWSIHCEEYRPYEFTQKDVEILWNTYLGRKIGLSYDQIKAMQAGEDIPLRESINNYIEKYEQQMVELQATIEIMKYVKGFGFIPATPESLMGSESFAEYLSALIDHLDKDRNLKSVINMAEIINKVTDIRDISDEQEEEIEKISRRLISSEEARQLGNENHKNLMHILNIRNLGPDSQEVQKWVKIYCLAGAEANRANNPELKISDCEYAFFMIGLIMSDSEIGLMFEKLLGKDGVDFLFEALAYYLENNYPDKINQYITG